MNNFPEFLPFDIPEAKRAYCEDNVVTRPEKYCFDSVRGIAIQSMLLNAATQLTAFDIIDIDSQHSRVKWPDKPEFRAIIEGFAFGLSSGGLLLPHYPMKTIGESHKCIRNILRICSIDPQAAVVSVDEDSIGYVNQQSYERMQELAGLSCVYIDRINGLDEVAGRITDELMDHDISNSLSFRTAYVIGVGAVAGAAHMLEMQEFESQVNTGVDIDRLCSQLLGQNS